MPCPRWRNVGWMDRTRRLHVERTFMTRELLTEITETIVQGDQVKAVEIARSALQAGLEPLAIVEQGLTPGMRIVGDRFACGDFFIPHLVMAGRAMQAAMKVLEPELK